MFPENIDFPSVLFKDECLDLAFIVGSTEMEKLEAINHLENVDISEKITKDKMNASEKYNEKIEVVINQLSETKDIKKIYEKDLDIIKNYILSIEKLSKKWEKINELITKNKPDLLLNELNKVNRLNNIKITLKLDDNDSESEHYIKRELKNNTSTGRDLFKIADLVHYLSSLPFNKKNTSYEQLCFYDLYFFGNLSYNSEILQKNLIVVCSPNVNVFFDIARYALNKKYGYDIPFLFNSDADKRLTGFKNTISSKKYNSDDHNYFSGFILVTRNPWNEDKIIIFTAGNCSIPTQACLLALIKGKDSNDLPLFIENKDDRYFQIPGRLLTVEEISVFFNNKKMEEN